MNVDANLMLRAGFSKEVSNRVGPSLTEPCDRFEINNPNRIAAFLGQCVIESNGFTAISEGLSYSSAERILLIFKRLRGKYPDSVIQSLVRNPEKLANYAYAGVNGNGDVASGDGWRYRGSGWKQLTGKANFAAAEKALGQPYLTNPDLVRQPAGASLTAAYFWFSKGCNTLADAWQLDNVTRLVNGPAMLQKAERASESTRILSRIR